MRRRLTFFSSCALALAVIISPARAEIFVEIPGVPGSATAAGHEGEIEAISLSLSGGQVVHRSGPKPCAPPSAKTQLSELMLGKVADVASPGLLGAAAAGTVFGAVTVTIAALDAGSLEDVSRYVLRQAFIATYDVSSSGGRPTESIGIRFQRLDFTTFASSEPETATWDLCGVGVAE